MHWQCSPVCWPDAAAKQTPPATNAPAVEATGEKITVILPRHEMDTIGFYEEKTREFEAQTGIKVELILMSWDQVADRPDRRSGLPAAVPTM